MTLTEKLFTLALILSALWFHYEHAHAQTVTASVPCTEHNIAHSSYCWEENTSTVEGKINRTGYFMGQQFINYWINPELMYFWTPTEFWYVTPNGIEY